MQPVVDPADPARHIGAVVAESPLSRDGRTPMAGTDFALDTSIVPVTLRLQFEGAADAGPGAFVVRTSSGEPLASVQLSDADLQASRQRFRDRRLAAEITLLLRRVQMRCGRRPEEVLHIATSATIGGSAAFC